MKKFLLAVFLLPAVAFPQDEEGATTVIRTPTITQPEKVSLKVYPENTDKAFGLVQANVPGKFMINSETLIGQVKKTELQFEQGTIVLWEGRPGRTYTVMFYPTDPKYALESVRVQLMKSDTPEPNPTPTPNPEPNPPNPPQPPSVESTTGFVIIETEDQDFQLNQVLIQLRKKSWSKPISILDKDQRDEMNSPDPQVQTILQAATAKGIQVPLVAGLSAAGETTFVIAVPDNYSEMEKILAEQGFKPIN